MKKPIKWLIGIVAVVGIVGGLTFAFVEGRKEMAREREREKPVKTPPRTSRTPGGEAVIKLDAETRQRVTIAVAPLAAATHAPEVKAFGSVLDPAPLLALHGELVAAEVALTNSTAQYQRTKALFEDDQNASRRALDAAEAQQRTDSARLLNAQQRWTLATGDAAAKMNSAERDQFVTKLVNRELALIRVEVPPGDKLVSPTGGRVTLQGDEDQSITVRSVYSAPTVDEKTRGQASLLVVEQPGPRLRPGAVATAFFKLPGDEASGVMLPSRAVVRAAGLAWAYVQTAENEFTRREVSTSAPMPDGWFVTKNFKPGEQVVVTGAQTLLSEEFKSQISVGDEAEKQ
ncbi:MAG: hypothetical protein HY298_05485 [Verrucomicrobia bacterium]|nr:hypothetical protein [Verrucomicrobiota bacterium]